MSKARILDIDSHRYKPHFLHGEDRAWTETNCYVDLWVELLHGYQLEPMAAFAFSLLTDYEGDSFTFFKLPLEDLYELYGLDVMEHNPWRSLPEHIAQQVALRRPMIVEVDSYYLPDTAGVSYGLAHVKTSVAVNAIDTEARTLGYFHGRGYWELNPEQYAGVFRVGAPEGPALFPRLPPYVEVVKTAALKRLSNEELKNLSVSQLRKHLARRPKSNPVRAWSADFLRDLDWMKTQSLEMFHQYSFALIRQLGSSAECSASYLRWLGQHGESGLELAALAMDALSSGAKTLQFRVARAVSGKRPWDPNPSLTAMAENWDSAMGLLLSRYGG